MVSAVGDSGSVNPTSLRGRTAYGEERSMEVLGFTFVGTSARPSFRCPSLDLEESLPEIPEFGNGASINDISFVNRISPTWQEMKSASTCQCWFVPWSSCQRLTQHVLGNEFVA